MQHLQEVAGPSTSRFSSFRKASTLVEGQVEVVREEEKEAVGPPHRKQEEPEDSMA